MKHSLLPCFLLLAGVPAVASEVTVYSNFSEDPSAGLGAYPYACADPSCSNLNAYTLAGC